MAGSLSGFFFDVEDFFGSTAVQRMSFTEKGVYLVMLFEEWRARERSLPDDPGAVADMIAISEAQAAEVAAAWPAARRKFVTDLRAPNRIVNLRLERTRRQQTVSRRKRAEAGRHGGNRKAANSRRIGDLEASNATATPSNAVATPSVVLGGVVLGSVELGKGREIPRAHTQTIFDGALPRDHATHVFCSASFSVCVPSAVHAKFLGSVLVPRFHGDREQAHKALTDWYKATAAALPAEAVMGDAFKFWQPYFDATWATAPAAAKPDDSPYLTAAKNGPLVRG